MKKIKPLIKKSEEFLSREFFTIINEVLLVFLSSMSLSIFIFYNGLNEFEFITNNIMESSIRSTILKIFPFVFSLFSLIAIIANLYKSINKNIYFFYKSLLLLTILINIQLFFTPHVTENYFILFSLLLFFDIIIFFLIKNLVSITSFNFLKKSFSPNYCLLGVSAAFLIYFVTIDIVRILQFQKSLDIGIISNLMYRLIHYFDSYTALTQQIFFSETHFSPIFIPLSVLYYLFPNPFFLSLFQDLLLVAGGIILYKVSVLVTKERYFSLFLSISYFLNPILHGIINYDFHEIAFFPFLFLLFIYYIEKEALLKSLLVLLLTLSVKEEIALYILPFSIYLFYRLKNLPFTIGYVFLCLGYFIFSTKFYMNHIMIDRFEGIIANRHEGFHGMFATFLSNPFFILNYLLQNDNKIIYLVVVFFSTGLIALKSKHFLLVLLPALFVSMLTWNFVQYSFSFHYGGPILPIIYFLVILGYKNLTESFKTKVAGVLLLNSWLLFMFYSPLYPASLKVTKDLICNYDSFQHFAAKVPKEKTVSASHSICTYFSNRDTIHLFPTIKNCEYIVVDLNASPWPLKDRKELFDTVNYLEKSGLYNIEEIHKSGFVKLHKNASKNNLFYNLLNPGKDTFNFYNLRNNIGKINYDEHAKFKLIWSNGNNTKKDFLSFGPYMKLDPGNYKVTFHLKSPANHSVKDPIGFVDVYSHPQGLGYKKITYNSISSDSVFKQVEVEFHLNESKSNMEFRLFCAGNAEILFDYLEVIRK